MKSPVKNRNEYQRKWRKKNPDKIKLNKKRYRIKHSERIREQRRKYRIKNKEKIKEQRRIYNLKNSKANIKYCKEYRIKNREKLKESNRLYCIKNRDVILERKKQYRIDHPEKNWRLVHPDRYKKLKKYTNKKIKSTPHLKMMFSLRNRIHKLIKRNKGIKKCKTHKLLGCTVWELRSHLESLFSLGMSWSNYGIKGWHIDHIIPCISFDLTKEEEQKKCFHYTNLQPLWAIDNMKKGAKKNS